MRRILCKIPRRPTAIVCAAVDGGGATVAAAQKKPFTNIFLGQSAWARKQLKNEERASKAIGILFRNYGGSAIQDDDDEKVAQTKNIRKVTEEEMNAFVTNFGIECGTDYEKYELVCDSFHQVIEEMDQDDDDDELGDATHNDRVDKLAEMAEEEKLDAFVTNSFTTNLMIECEPKYEKRFRQVIEKVRKKSIQDDVILNAFELVTKLMRKCEPEYEKLLRQVLEKVCDKITQDEKKEQIGEFLTNLMVECEPRYDKRFHCVIETVSEKILEDDGGTKKASLYLTRLMSSCEPGFRKLLGQVLEKLRREKIITQDEVVGNENARKIVALSRLVRKASAVYWFRENENEFVMRTFLTNLKMVEKMKPYFMVYEVIEKVAKKVGNENVRKIAEEKLDTLVTNSFLSNTVEVKTMKPILKLSEWVEIC